MEEQQFQELAPKRKRGRPRADIDPKKLEALCQVHATDQEIAAHFGVCLRTIEGLKKKPEYRDVFARGRADGKISLRRAQWQAALAGSAAMMIWLGKQELGQAEKLEHTGAKGGPIQVQQVREMLDGLSDDDFRRLAQDAGVKISDADPAQIGDVSETIDIFQ